MLASSFGYFLKNPERITAALRDPLEAWIAFQDRRAEQRERLNAACNYVADESWEPHLHERLGVPSPCTSTNEFRELWTKVIESLQATGLRVGPESFHTWNDGDRGLVRAIWCLTRHLRPGRVLETGVAHGLTSRFILEAMHRNGRGHLWSIDRPPLDPKWQAQVGIAVTDPLRGRWSYIEGSSRHRLPRLLSQIGGLDMFIHDSLHSERNVRFELDSIWPLLRPGGSVVIDDIDANWGFHSFIRLHPGHPSFICEAEPLHPDPRRFNGKGLFGIILKVAE
jgi:hypothetical protein